MLRPCSNVGTLSAVYRSNLFLLAKPPQPTASPIDRFPIAIALMVFASGKYQTERTGSPLCRAFWIAVIRHSNFSAASFDQTLGHPEPDSDISLGREKGLKDLGQMFWSNSIESNRFQFSRHSSGHRRILRPWQGLCAAPCRTRLRPSSRCA